MNISQTPVVASSANPAVPIARVFDNDRSSAAYRLRIALHLKRLDPRRDHVVIHGAAATHRESAYAGINPQRLVPAIELADGTVLTQTLAIIEYLDELVPAPPLLPTSAVARAAARSVALAVACDIHPFGTPRVGLYLGEAAGLSPDAVRDWTRHWIREGLDSLERLLATHRKGRYAIDDVPGIADIFLAPQALVAERQGFDLGQWPILAEVVASLRLLPAFSETVPA